MRGESDQFAIEQLRRAANSIRPDLAALQDDARANRPIRNSPLAPAYAMIPVRAVNF